MLHLLWYYLYLIPMKIISGLCLILAINSGLKGQDNISKSDWNSSRLNIDGNNKDWLLPFNFYDRSTGLKFDISNNSSSIYLFFMTNDNIKIMKMMNAGWQLQLSSNEKNKKFSSTIIFPAVPVLDKITGENTIQTDMDFNSLVNEYKMFLPGIKTKGFKTKNGELPLVDTAGINIAIGTDSLKNLCFEISIPLSELIDADLIRLNEVLQLNIRLNGMKIPAEEKNNNNDPYGSGNYGRGSSSMSRGYGQGMPNYGNPYTGDLLLYNNARQSFRLTGNQ